MHKINPVCRAKMSKLNAQNITVAGNGKRNRNRNRNRNVNHLALANICLPLALPLHKALLSFISLPLSSLSFTPAVKAKHESEISGTYFTKRRLQTTRRIRRWFIWATYTDIYAYIRIHIHLPPSQLHFPKRKLSESWLSLSLLTRAHTHTATQRILVAWISSSLSRSPTIHMRCCRATKGQGKGLSLSLCVAAAKSSVSATYTVRAKS